MKQKGLDMNERRWDIVDYVIGIGLIIVILSIISTIGLMMRIGVN